MCFSCYNQKRLTVFLPVPEFPASSIFKTAFPSLETQMSCGYNSPKAPPGWEFWKPQSQKAGVCLCQKTALEIRILFHLLLPIFSKKFPTAQASPSPTHSRLDLKISTVPVVLVAGLLRTEKGKWLMSRKHAKLMDVPRRRNKFLLLAKIMCYFDYYSRKKGNNERFIWFL